MVSASVVTVSGSSVSAGVALSSSGFSVVRVVVEDADATVILRGATDAFDLSDRTLMKRLFYYTERQKSKV